MMVRVNGCGGTGARIPRAGVKTSGGATERVVTAARTIVIAGTIGKTAGRTTATAEAIGKTAVRIIRTAAGPGVPTARISRAIQGTGVTTAGISSGTGHTGTITANCSGIIAELSSITVKHFRIIGDFGNITEIISRIIGDTGAIKKGIFEPTANFGGITKHIIPQGQVTGIDPLPSPTAMVIPAAFTKRGVITEHTDDSRIRSKNERHLDEKRAAHSPIILTSTRLRRRPSNSP